jgi:hypothetical protein
MRLPFVMAIWALAGSSVLASEFFVTLNGKDTNPGTRQSPFASFQRAQEAARSGRTAHPGEAVTVTFGGGTYPLDRTLDFTTADSGASAEKPVRYRAQPGESVVISGGRVITGWEPDRQRPRTWKTRVAQGAVSTPGPFEQLWVNGRRAVRARTPNYWQFGMLTSVTEEPDGTGGGVTHTFTARPDLFAALQGLDESALRQVQVVVFHKWDTTREWLQSASPAQGTFTTRGSKMQGWNRMERDCLFYFENCLAALDAPGEWFLDTDGWVYYQPAPGEDMKTAEVVAPQLERFLSIQGNAEDPARWAQHLVFDGLEFRYGELHVPTAGLPPAQAAMNVSTTAIQVDAARNIRFTNCAVEHIGSTAFWFRHACRDCRVDGTRMYDIGIGGVRIGEPNIVPEPVRTGGITIDNCIIQSGGRIMPHTVAVWIGHNADNAITHCDIGDWFYTAVSVGWRWGYAESAAKHNRIEFNHLHHLGYRILSDMGGVYTLGPSEGTTVRNNVIHDVYSTRYGGWGLYTDEGSTGILLENNLVYDVRDGCVHQHYGKENIFRNNILAFSEEGQVAITRSEPHLSFTFERNLVYWDEGYLLGYAGWRAGAKVVLQNNLYWRAGTKPFDFGGKSWDEWRVKGNDQGSLIADPLFVDPAKRDFRLRPGSPAGKVGFQPFDISAAGVYGDSAWQKLATSISFPKPYVVPSPEPVKIRDAFESGKITPLLGLASLDHEGHPELIAITDAQAASGKHSLRVQDRADLKAAYNPHFYWDPNYTKGPARLTFKIRIEPGADAHCEWRDPGNPYRTGPSLRFQNTTLSERGRKLMEIPANAWIGVEMRATLGRSDSRWNLKITLPDGTGREFKDLPCDSAWKEARWVGFSSMGRDGVSFYLDDLEMENNP